MRNTIVTDRFEPTFCFIDFTKVTFKKTLSIDITGLDHALDWTCKEGLPMGPSLPGFANACFVSVVPFITFVTILHFICEIYCALCIRHVSGLV